MTIDVFAAGTGDFHTHFVQVTSSDVYNVAELLSTLQSPPKSVGEYVKGKVKDKVKDKVFPANMQNAMDRYGNIESLWLLDEAIQFALLDTTPIILSVSMFQEHVLWPTTGANVLMTLSADDDAPTRDVLKRITPGLDNTDMKQFTTLLALAKVFGGFSNSGGYGKDGNARLNIVLTN
ncbi:MAG: hypothetical protein GC186_09205 [Rhodobacteraceae bacterium]|nr:hypothetical protein [Paracoccaceae bacterium]